MHLTRIARQFCPRTKMMSSILNSIMLKRASDFLLPIERVVAGEVSNDARREAVCWCERHWKRAYKEAVDDAQKHLSLSTLPKTQDTLLDVLFCHFAYGFSSDEYLAFELNGKSSEERKSYLSDRNRIILAIRTNDFFDAGIFLDKYKTYLAYHDVFKRDAVLIKTDNDKQEFISFVEKHPVFIKKRVDLARGESVSLIALDGTPEMRDSCFTELRKQGTCILEEKIEQAEAMSVFHPTSVNTVRCIAFWGKDGVEIPYCILRTGRGSSVIDNASAGGISAAIDPQTGTVITDGMDERNTVFREHPDGHIAFIGYQLPEWSAFLTLIEDVATRRKGIRFIGWDVAYSTKGWCIVEGNYAPQVEARQVLCGGMKKDFDRLLADFD